MKIEDCIKTAFAGIDGVEVSDPNPDFWPFRFDAKHLAVHGLLRDESEISVKVRKLIDGFRAAIADSGLSADAYSIPTGSVLPSCIGLYNLCIDGYPARLIFSYQQRQCAWMVSLDTFQVKAGKVLDSLISRHAVERCESTALTVEDMMRDRKPR